MVASSRTRSAGRGAARAERGRRHRPAAHPRRRSSRRRREGASRDARAVAPCASTAATRPPIARSRRGARDQGRARDRVVARGRRRGRRRGRAARSRPPPGDVGSAYTTFFGRARRSRQPGPARRWRTRHGGCCSSGARRGRVERSRRPSTNTARPRAHRALRARATSVRSDVAAPASARTMRPRSRARRRARAARSRSSSAACARGGRGRRRDRRGGGAHQHRAQLRARS